ncbi:photosynthetic complex putative assembly protein PuhB [Methylopila turkensis]|uniref:Photosynthetic complex assembly protein n=1 Tax=Methylopila turkensis TaxID=1437816 RepID=A0A9W6JJE6_9HYPH|nr:photosynthetic complex putative assembly protein PuhB [Methylopila turkensis]GLK78287.1 photosynthetic complex assembly protein [Methylopila turkensis]
MSAGAAPGGETRPYGLPGPLPRGERVLWQGKPDWRALAWRAFHVREVAIYVALFAIWRAGSELAETGSATAAALNALSVAPFALAAIGMLALLAWLSARYAVYTLTNRRVVLSIGVALTATLNLPLERIERADLKVFGDGSGDLSLGLGAGDRIALFHLWPHARPWRARSPEPTLRAISDPERVARLVAEALAPNGAQRMLQPSAQSQPAGAAPTHALAS